MTARLRLLSNWRAGGVPALPIILAAGVVLRLINIGGRPLWYDEAFAMLYARLPYQTMLEGTIAQSEGAAADVHPLFYYMSLQKWAGVFGGSAATARLLSLVYGTATIAVVYFIMRELFDRRTALIAALCAAVSPFQIAYSQEARMYAQLGFWSSASLWAFVRGARTNDIKMWIAFGLCGAAALYSHNLSFAFFAAMGLFVVVRFVAGLARRVVRTSLLFGAITGALIMSVLFSPWLSLLPAQLGKIAQSYWITPPTALTLVQTLLAFGFWTDNQAAAPALAIAMLAGSILIVALIAREAIRRRQAIDVPTKIGLLAMLWLVPIVVLVAVSYALKPVYVIRGLIPSQIAFLMLAAWAASRLPRAVQRGLAVLLGAVLIAALGAHYSYAGFPRAPWPAIAAHIRANALPDDLVIHDNKLTFFPMHVVDPGLNQVYLPDLAGIGSDTLALPTQEALGLRAVPVEEAAAGRARVWLIIFSRTRADYRTAGLADDPHWLAIESQFDIVAEWSFGDVELYLFATKDRIRVTKVVLESVPCRQDSLDRYRQPRATR